VSRIVEPANDPEPVGMASRDAWAGDRPIVAAVLLAELLAEGPPQAELVVVGLDELDSPAAVGLVAAHNGAENLIVVLGASSDLRSGQAGAFTGLGGPFVVARATLVDALEQGPVDEVELRWILWNDGAVVGGAGGALAGRAAAISEGRAVVVGGGDVQADRVPAPPWRAASRREATVPTLSIIVHGGTSLSALDSIPDSARRPSEVLVVGDEHPMAGRIRRTQSVDHAITEARGSIVVFVHAEAVVDREGWARLLRRFDDERAELVRSAYITRNGPARSSRGMLAVDSLLGAPAFAAARRRVLRKLRAPMVELWPAAIERERSMVVLDPPAAIDVEVPRAALPGIGAAAGLVADVAAAGLISVRERARDTVRASTPNAAGEPGGAQRPSVGLIGFSGYENFGDELVLRAARELLEGVDVEPGGQGTHGTVLGGGTLLNAGRFYQRVADRIDAPGLHRLVLGTGVVSPDVKGWTESLEQWRPFLEAGPVGVRGPDSVAHLRTWGWDGPIEVLGDPALAVVPQGEARDGLVVLSPIGASSVGQVEEADERAQIELLTEAARRWLADGREVVLFSAHPGDDRVMIELLRRVGRADLEVCHAGRDLDAGLELLASADLVVGARLHALVAAASAGTPFVGLAYRPKVLDFARSVQAGRHAGPIGSWTVDSLLAAAEAAGTERSRNIVDAAVQHHRTALRARASEFVSQLES
jgi:hypothetical protein